MADASEETCPQRPTDEDMARKTAGEWFAKGTAYAAEERYTEAEEAFGCSYALVPHPATLLNLAKAANLAGHINVALETYEAFIEQYPDEEKADMAKAELIRLRATVSESQDVRSTEEDVSGDTSSVTEKPDTDTARQTQTPSEAPEIVFRSLEQSGVGAPQVDVEHKNIPRPSSDMEGRTNLKKTVFALMLTGVIGTAAGIGFGSTSLYYLRRAMQSGIWLDEFNDRREKMTHFGIASIATLSVGCTALISGITLLLIDNERRTNTKVSRVNVLFSPQHIGISIPF